MIATGDMKIQIQKTTDKWIIINFQPLVKWYEWLIKCISALNKNKEADEKKKITKQKKSLPENWNREAKNRSTTLILRNTNAKSFDSDTAYS